MATDDAGNVLQSSLAHDVVIPHEKAEFGRCLLHEVANVGVVAEVLFVVKVTQEPRIARLICTNNCRNLLAFWRQVFADHDFKILKALGNNRVQEFGKTPRPIVGRDADRKKLAILAHALSHKRVLGLKTFTGFAGAPATMVLAGTSPLTTAFAAIMAPLPISAGPTITELSP